MSVMSRVSTKLVVLVAALLLAGCPEADPEEAPDEPEPEAAPDEAADDPEVTLELGHVWAEDDPQAEAVAEFAESVDELSGGSVTVEIYPAGQLGGDRDILEGLEIGTNDMWVGGAGVYNAMTDAGLVFVVPFMFEDIGEAMDAYDGQLGEEINQRIEEESETRVLAYWPRGPRHLTLNDAVENPDDVGGARIRVPENPMFIQSWERMGANPTSMEFPEVFTALQQGAIDGQENPLALIESAGFYQVQSHLNLTSHVIEPLAVSISTATWESLTEAQQAALLEAAEGDAKSNFRQVVEEEEDQLREELEEAGMTVVEPDRDAFVEQVDGLVEEQFPEISDLHATATGTG